MIKSTLKLGLFCVLLSALVGAPVQVRAQATNKPAAGKKATKETATAKKSGVIPFHGKLKAVDKTAKTITLGETTVQITSETKIKKDGKPATLDDGVIGENVSGAYTKAADGKMNATTVRFGAKAESEKTADKKTKKQNKEE